MNRSVRQWLGSVVVFGLSIMVVSCGGSGKDTLPPRAKAAGSVTYNGQPVEGAVVSFMPVKKEGRSATGTSNSKGAFILTTFNTDDGALPGTYKVGVVKPPKAQPLSAEEQQNPSKYMARKQNPALAKKAAKEKPAPELPEKYMDPEKSGLQYTVEEGKANHFDVKLTDDK